MKRNVLTGLIVICVCGGVFLSLKNQRKPEKVNGLLLENIEALAADEESDDILCVGSGCVLCPTTNVKVKYVLSRSMLKN